MDDAPLSTPPDKDDVNLRRLEIAHWVFAGFSGIQLLLILWLASIYFRLGMLETRPESGPAYQKAASSLLFLSILPTIMLTLNLLSAFFIRRRQCRVFSLSVAVIDCLFFPLGLIPAIPTLVLLYKEPIIAKYRADGAVARRPGPGSV